MSGEVEVVLRKPLLEDCSEKGDSDGTERAPSDSGKPGSTSSRYSGNLSLLRRDSVRKVFNSFRRNKSSGSTASQSNSTEVSDSDDKSVLQSDYKAPKSSIGLSTIVIVVLVEAKGLPDPPDDGYTHRVHGKFQLGSQSYKSKTTKYCRQPKWGERFKLSLRRSSLLQISLWDSGKNKNFMGNCSIDLSNLERERSHEIWQNLDDGFGSVHLSVTLCATRNVDAAPTSLAVDVAKDEYAWHKLNSDWGRVGQMHVKVVGAKGLSGRPQAYAVLAVDNERVQTHCCSGGAEPVWDKGYLFNIYDITSTLDIKVYDSSLVNLFQDGFVGRISIPLLQLNSGTSSWYALKDKSKKYSAKGNCPRILIETTIFWNPVKSALRVFQPKEVKHTEKNTNKFDIALVYNNVEFIRDLFLLLIDINECIKRVFEWENKEASFMALVLWLVFWYHFEVWMVPMFLVIPFIYFWFFGRGFDDEFTYLNIEAEKEKDKQNEKSNDKTLTRRIQGLPEMTLTITNSIEYIVSVAEKLYNLASFKVPFLSYVAIALLVATSFTLYMLPFKYLLMTFGIYKFTRKYLNPERVLNNDLVDFLSRIPDNEMLKEWRQLSVPEPTRNISSAKSNSLSTRRSVPAPWPRDPASADHERTASALTRSYSTRN